MEVFLEVWRVRVVVLGIYWLNYRIVLLFNAGYSASSFISP